MSEQDKSSSVQRYGGLRIYALVAIVSLAAGVLLLALAWPPAPPFPSKFWNGIVAFTLLAIISESLFFRIPFANVSTSVSFVPFLASIALFSHPWPMLMSGVTA